MKSRTRHLVKSLTYRVLSVIATFIVVWFMTGDITVSIGITSIDVWVKMILYYLHERAWHKIRKRARQRV